MKKIMFLQLESGSLGGIWYVNKTLSESLAKHYDVEIVSLMKKSESIDELKNVKQHTINDKIHYKTILKKDILKSITSFKIVKSYYMIKNRIARDRQAKINYSDLKDYIVLQKPDYIINSHYELLEAIPSDYLSKTINVFHTSYNIAKKEMMKSIRTFKKYKNKIAKFVWLSKSTSSLAINDGITNSIYIYNPIRFSIDKKADVINNKKLITMCRLSAKEKNINAMVRIVDEIFKEVNDWTFELYGPELPDQETLKIINNNSRIILKGITKEPKSCLMNSSVYLSTSQFEGFSLSILEASACGIPTVTYNFGEAVYEEVNDKTGIIVKLNDEEEFKTRLKELINNKELLSNYSKETFNFSLKFTTDEITNKWLKLLDEVGENNEA